MTENPQDPGYLPPAPADAPDPGTPVYDQTVEASQPGADPTYGNESPSDLPTTGPDQPDN